jgi:hypothetical protein
MEASHSISWGRAGWLDTDMYDTLAKAEGNPPLGSREHPTHPALDAYAM